MKPLLPALLLGVSLTIATITPAAAYPVDCAILLCLAGGWPASAECAHAQAIFIRRITPWPIEPPLQIWNCPMHAGFRRSVPVERPFDIAFLPSSRPQFSEPTLPFPALIPVLDQADVDISDAAFDFVRSIRVFEITYQQHRNSEGDCRRSSSVFMGTYGEQGDYGRRSSSIAEVPASSDFEAPSGCLDYQHRSVFVEWRDYESVYGHEEVHY